MKKKSIDLLALLQRQGESDLTLSIQTQEWTLTCPRCSLKGGGANPFRSFLGQRVLFFPSLRVEKITFQYLV